MLRTNSHYIDAQNILKHIEEFEDFCFGQTKFTPEHFRNINQAISIGAALLIGKHRFEKKGIEQHLYWTGIDNEEYYLGPTNNKNITQNFPGFNTKHSLALTKKENIIEKNVHKNEDSRKSIVEIILLDGTKGYGIDFKTALRNAVLKSELEKIKTRSLFSLFKKIFSKKTSI